MPYKVGDKARHWIASEASWGYGTVVLVAFILPIFSERKPDLWPSVLQMLVSSDLIGASLCFVVSALYMMSPKHKKRLGFAANSACLFCALFFMGFKSFPLSIPDKLPFGQLHSSVELVWLYSVFTVLIVGVSATVVFLSKCEVS